MRTAIAIATIYMVAFPSLVYLLGHANAAG